MIDKTEDNNFPSYEKILARKQSYYGKTEASYHFAAEEYANECLLFFKNTKK